MNDEQIKSFVRWVLTVLGSLALGWLAAKNLLTVEQIPQVTSFLGSESFVSFIMAVGSLIWSLFAHTHSATITAADKIDEVKKIDLKSTVAGAAMEKSVARSTVVVGGK